MKRALAYIFPQEPRKYEVYINEFIYGLDEIQNWMPQIVIEFNSWISRSEAADFTEWCLHNCDGKFIQPKVWWIEFEFKEDFQKFQKHFNLRIPTAAPRLPSNVEIEKSGVISVNGTKCHGKVSQYELDFLWSHINDWCNENCISEWFVSPYNPTESRKEVSWYKSYYCFKNLDDAMKFKLVWG